MAALFAVGLPFTYDGTTNHFATTTGGSATVAAVTSADTVTIDGNSGNAALTVGAAWSSGAITINNASASLVCDGTHGITSSGAMTVTTGTLNTNGQTCSWASFAAVAGTRVINITNSTITLTANGTTVWDLGSATGLTFTSTGSTLSFSGSGAQLRGSGVTPTYNNLTWTNVTANAGIGNGCTVNGTLSVTGGAVKTANFFVVTGMTLNGAWNINGNSTTNRLLVCGVNSSGNGIGVGVQRTVVANSTITTSYTDWQDVKAAGTSGSWNFSAATGGSGDCGGNSGITFTTPAAQTYTDTGVHSDNFSTLARWTSRIPLPQDNVTVPLGSTGTLTFDMPRSGASVDFTGYTGTWTVGIANTIFGSLTLATGMTLGGGNVNFTFAGRGSHTINLLGKSWFQTTTFNQVGGTYTLANDFLCTASITHNWGTLDASTFNVMCTTFASTNANIRSIKMGTANTWTMTSVVAAATVWNLATTTNLTFDGGTSTLTHNGTTASVITLFWSLGSINFTYNNISLSTAQQTITHSFSNGATINGTYTQRAGNVSSWSTSPVVFNNAPVITGSNFGYLRLPGTTGNYANTPDSAALSVTGDIDIRHRVAFDTWTPAAASALVTKRTASSNVTLSYGLMVLTSGLLEFDYSDGTSAFFKTSSVATGLSAGTTGWIRVTRSASTGVITFYTASGSLATPAGGDWVQLGSTVAGTTGNIRDGAEALEVGTYNVGASGFTAANHYRTIIYSDLTETTKVFDADFTTKTVGANSFSESSSNAATVTINGLAAQVGDGRVTITGSQGAANPAHFRVGASSITPYSLDYLSLTDVHGDTNAGALGTGLWYAGSHSVDGGDNTGWTFTAPPGASNHMMLMGM